MPAYSPIVIREALPYDNEGLLQLTALTPMKGNVTLFVDRKPDFFGLLRQRGPFYTFVAECNDQIIGSGSISEIAVYIKGKEEKAYYLGDFKVHPDFQRSTVAVRLAKATIEKLNALNANLIFCAITTGNKAIVPFFQGRLFFPLGLDAGKFNVFQIIPSPLKMKPDKYQTVEVLANPDVAGFLDKFMMKYQFAQIQSETNLRECRIITAVCGKEVVAAIALANPDEWKQEVLLKVKILQKIMLATVNALPGLCFPRLNEPVRVLYIRSFACKSGHEKALEMLLTRARNIAFEEKFHFLSIGLHEKNTYLKLFRAPLHITLESNMYIGSMKNETDKIVSLLHSTPFLDYSLI
ncbi:GNAT family N-acetyltransferase [Parabacteroides sp. FAFU027]|uniref:GNAT family N-acetyltransferase n=1 Tax=Parabacteroides sp. FAFU027 TaxID=2922715 RepID=UPI001FAE87CB|nr:GNAT family N-acetyltransferase [Parabacteroides sp. FAFU027]